MAIVLQLWRKLTDESLIKIKVTLIAGLSDPRPLIFRVKSPPSIDQVHVASFSYSKHRKCNYPDVWIENRPAVVTTLHGGLLISTYVGKLKEYYQL